MCEKELKRIQYCDLSVVCSCLCLDVCEYYCVSAIVCMCVDVLACVPGVHVFVCVCLVT